jgi:hypothetical protein
MMTEMIAYPAAWMMCDELILLVGFNSTPTKKPHHHKYELNWLKQTTHTTFDLISINLRWMIAITHHLFHQSLYSGMDADVWELML